MSNENDKRESHPSESERESILQTQTAGDQDASSSEEAASVVVDREFAAKVVIAADRNEDIPISNDEEKANDDDNDAALPPAQCEQTFRPRPPQQEEIYPGAEAVKGPDFNDSSGTIVLGEEGEEDDVPVVAQIVDVDTEEELRQQIRSLEERLRQVPTTSTATVVGTPVAVATATPMMVASAESQDVKEILWVDDNPGNIMHMAKLLSERGFHITNSTSTNEARQLLLEGTYDVIISDVRRIEDGEEHCDAGYQLLHSPEVGGVPLIFCLSNVSYLDQDRSAGSFGAADDFYDLFNLVMRAVSL